MHRGRRRSLSRVEGDTRRLKVREDRRITDPVSIKDVNSYHEDMTLRGSLNRFRRTRGRD